MINWQDTLQYRQIDKADAFSIEINYHSEQVIQCSDRLDWLILTNRNHTELVWAYLYGSLSSQISLHYNIKIHMDLKTLVEMIWWNITLIYFVHRHVFLYTNIYSPGYIHLVFYWALSHIIFSQLFASQLRFFYLSGFYRLTFFNQHHISKIINGSINFAGSGGNARSTHFLFLDEEPMFQDIKKKYRKYLLLFYNNRNHGSPNQELIVSFSRLSLMHFNFLLYSPTPNALLIKFWFVNK